MQLNAPSTLEQYLIEAAAHGLRAVFHDVDPFWVRACARLQVLGSQRSKLNDREAESCRSMLATFESAVRGRSLPFAPGAQQIIVRDEIHASPPIPSVHRSDLCP